MQAEPLSRPYSQGERGLLLVSRLLTATPLTSIVGAIENWFYERFFAPDLYAAGHPLARAMWGIAWTFPFILVGLLMLGLPAAWLLRRGRVENALSYAAAGAATGTLFGVLLGFQTARGSAVAAFYGCVCAVLWWLLRRRV